MQSVSVRSLALLLSLLNVSFASARASDQVTLENDLLRISLSPQDASLTVTDKRNGLLWRQQVRPGFQLAPAEARVSPAAVSCRVLGDNDTYTVTISFTKECPHG